MTDWQTLSTTAPAENDFPTLSQHASLMALNQLAVISVSGADAESFLQNLVTNHVAALTPPKAQYNGLCNPKGRLLATFILVRAQAEQFYIVVSADLCDSLTKRLSMYVLRSKVTITSGDDAMQCIGLTQQLPDAIAPPAEPYDVVDMQHNLVIRLPGELTRFLVLATAESSATLCQTWLKSDYRLASPDYWQWLDIQAGLAHVVSNTLEQFTPQQINLDLNDGVSFNKGCYPGQEVVARLHYLGKPSRRLFIGSATSTMQPEAGSEVLTTSGQVAGHIVSACQYGQHLDCLISLKLKEFDDTLQLSDGTPVEIHGEAPQEEA